jgi:hypothetical protein
MRNFCPCADQHRAFENEGLTVGSSRQAIEQTLDAVAAEDNLEVLAPLPREP